VTKATTKSTKPTRQPQWQHHFELTSSPFSKDIADGELWLPNSKQALVDELREAVEARQHALLVGEPGVGKTCTLRALREHLPETDYRLTYCHNATLGRRDFYRQLCLALGLSPRATAAAVFHSVSSHVEELGRQRVHPVFLLDEAHLLQQQVLEHLHVLANYQWDQKPLLSMVLVGLPELWGQLALRKNRSLWSRIDCRLSIEAPSVADTTEYVERRLRRAGASKLLLGADALTILHEATHGQLRDIDRIATSALRAAARRKQSMVDRELLEQVLERDQQPRCGS
jgi:type II secretory pathway predicted ATPase ExeA